jgi:hypothetical protein
MSDKPRGLFALDAHGRRLDVDPFEALEGAMLLDLAGAETESVIAAYELVDEGRAPLVLPASLGTAAIVDAISLRVVPKGRGPKRTGPDPGYGQVIEEVASFWLAIGRPPSQAIVAEELGYSEQSAFARAIRDVGWPNVRLLAAWQLRRWHDRLLGQMAGAAPTTLEQARLRERFAALSRGSETPS